MSKLGFSIYPEHSSYEEVMDYVREMVELGCTRVFSCFLSLDGDGMDVVAYYTRVFKACRELGLEVVVDTNPEVFKKYGASVHDVSFFHDLGVSGIRLDGGFDGLGETLLTYNPYNLKIEFNASNLDGKFESLLAHQPNMENVIACHNFYPERYTGLGEAFFDEASAYVKRFNVRLAAFVGSQVKDAYGPWKVKEGLVTLEKHRNLPLETQIRQMVAHRDIDDIIISNVRPDCDELNAIRKLNLNQLQFKITLGEISDVEREIIFATMHVNRPDYSADVIRSSLPRMLFKTASLPAHDTLDLIPKGSVFINNDQYDRYKGELLIARKDLVNDGQRNVVGTIAAADFDLLPLVSSWTQFSFIAA